ncbi:transposase [Streptomyces sp. NPDC000410]|uniref:RNA-guided endonuclease InsQ/TnpB family protein n=1 Tax=Streptomyces sp. NPDC000410 TaxID=3154254 RepID=UPI0033283615
MKLVVQVKLEPTPVQAAALEATLTACNEAAMWVSQVAFERSVKDVIGLRKLTYQHIKEEWSLGAQAAQHVIKKVCDAYRTLSVHLKAGHLGRPHSKRWHKATAKPVDFRTEGAQPFDDRMLSWQHEQHRLSIWTVHGRVKDLAFTGSPEQLARVAQCRQGESDLLLRDGMWFLAVTVDIPQAPLNEQATDVIGCDLGIVNLVTTSDGTITSNRHLNRLRAREAKLRAKLQKKNTRSAKRRLAKRRRKEARRNKDINHKISKRLVAEAQRTGRGIALEDLKGIRERVRLRKPQRAAVHSWPFAQLADKLRYKAARAGVPVVFVGPAYTSRTCSECWCVDKANRVSQAWFACRSCGFVDHADRNASRVIRARGRAMLRRCGAPPTAPASPWQTSRGRAGRTRSATAGAARSASPLL